MVSSSFLSVLGFSCFRRQKTGKPGEESRGFPQSSSPGNSSDKFFRKMVPKRAVETLFHSPTLIYFRHRKWATQKKHAAMLSTPIFDERTQNYALCFGSVQCLIIPFVRSRVSAWFDRFHIRTWKTPFLLLVYRRIKICQGDASKGKDAAWQKRPRPFSGSISCVFFPNTCIRFSGNWNNLVQILLIGVVPPAKFADGAWPWRTGKNSSGRLKNIISSPK